MMSGNDKIDIDSNDVFQKETKDIFLKKFKKEIEVPQINPSEKHRLEKLYLNISSKIKRIVGFPGRVIRKVKVTLQKIVHKTIRSQQGRDLQDILVLVIGYGLIGWFVLFTFAGFKWHPFYVFGVGGAIYLFQDLFGFIVDKIRGKTK